MIVVIADDFTGASEIGGIGLRHGLNVIIQTSVPIRKKADMVVIAANTRSMTLVRAVQVIKKISETLISQETSLIYKKIDSVLRGHVMDELQMQMNVMNMSNALVIPGNISMKRVVHNGKLYINGVLLSKTEFANDPNFPALSSDVLEVLDPNRKFQLSYSKPTKEIPEGIVVGEASCEADVNHWTENLVNNTLYAGAANFFDTIISSLKIRPSRGLPFFPFGRRMLFVGGTTYPKPKGFYQKLAENGIIISEIPDVIYETKDFHSDQLDIWSHEIKEALEEQSVYITIRKSGSKEIGLSNRLGQNLGELVSNITSSTIIDELLIEGGDTASFVLKFLNIDILSPVQVFGNGVTRMEVIGERNFYITTKPGSYKWPDECFQSSPL